MDNDDLLAVFIVLFLAVMLWAFAAEHRISFPGLSTAMGNQIEEED